MKDNFFICTTLETNRMYKSIMNNCRPPKDRSLSLSLINHIKKFITIEPIIDFELFDFIKMIKSCDPAQVNIGADSNPKRNKLPEPPKGKILELIAELETFTKVVKKENLKRLLK